MSLKPITLILCLANICLAQAPRDSFPLNSANWPEHYRIHTDSSAKIIFTDDFSLNLTNQSTHDVAIEHPSESDPILRVWSAGKLVRGPENVPSLSLRSSMDFPNEKIDFSTDFTAMVRFQCTGNGTLISKCHPNKKWSPNAKALFIRNGRLVYDIGWLKEIHGEEIVNDGKPHTAVLILDGKSVRMYLDHALIAQDEDMTRPDEADHILKVGRAATNFAGDFSQGKIHEVKIWKRALPDKERALLFKNDAAGANTPDFTHRPKAPNQPKIQGATGWIQALEKSDHSEIVRTWNDATFKEGEEIYKTNCIICHGMKDQVGSLPTALRFAEGTFKNGADPFSMYQTVTKGFGQMVAQPQYTTAQKYAVIHYIREAFLKPHNKSQYTEITPELLENLPKGLVHAETEKIDRSLPPYKLMDIGPTLFWTYQIEKGNIAQKGLAVRLDQGTGGVTKGRAWMIYDNDTMRVATATTGDFVDWKGIAFDGSHGTHTSLIGDKHFINPPGPGWASPEGKWDDDSRIVGKDGKNYGPLPHSWAKFDGLYRLGHQVALTYQVHGVKVLESPSLLEENNTPIFSRTLNISPTEKTLQLRIAPENINVAINGSAKLTKQNGFWIASLNGGTNVRIFLSHHPQLSTIAENHPAEDLAYLTKGGAPLWTQTVENQSTTTPSEDPFTSDEFPLPNENPWHSWLRPGGFDFTPDGKAAIVAMWNGDVWRVDGVMEKAPAKLTWRRIACGLFQPLGVKFRDQELFITCRDQIAKLVDINHDGEIDFTQCFNGDAQVTEHFHEFAMGLQTDNHGNFYYAKSARHALDSIVPHHGTLLKVSADGSKTEIIANGFRAANGVCINDDGTFFVTDQEGHWTPKNRINRVKPGGFYGNIYSYGAVNDKSDSAMQQPMISITNAKDRSPAELLWVPKNAWGNLGGSLLNLSYGTGRPYIVPHEKSGDLWQGAVCELPMPEHATGIMRGRFSPDGNLYTCGMFAWAGNAITPGGFYRIRRTHTPARLPLTIHAEKNSLTLTFSDPLPDTTAKIKVWSLTRSANYGSKHINEHDLEIRSIITSTDKRTITLEIPDLAPTHCYELTIGDRTLHGTIHQLNSQ